jgi:hypothetical protein
MRTNLTISAIVLPMIVLLAINPAMPVLASSSMLQITSPYMKGLAFTPSGCCPEVSTNLNGNIVTDADGTMNLLQQSGSVMLGSTGYNLQFTPTGNLSIQQFSEGCASGTTYSQDGEIKLTGSDGTIIKGSGTFSWGTSLDCTSNTYTFTNFSGEIQDSMGQTTKFFTGTGSLPSIQ